MIEKLETLSPEDLAQLTQIWLKGNIEAHDFIPQQYWQQQLPLLQELLPAATLLIDRQDNSITGFLGLQENYLAGLFVLKEHRRFGIGEALLKQAKTEFPQLNLSVYQKNISAIKFYQKNNFEITGKSIDQQTQEIELHMSWQSPTHS